MLANTKLFYSHFIDEHVQGHHKNVSTPVDSSTSRLNETVYTYIVREVIGTHISQWKREVSRIKKRYSEDCPLLYLIVFNNMTRYFAFHATICALIYFLLGWASLKHQFCHAFVGLCFQCFANYQGHYGLNRNKDKNGLYESVNKYHSWNQASSAMFFRLARHSDHHAASFRPY